MSLSTPRQFYGIHTVTPYNRTTGLFYGELRVVMGASLGLTGQLVECKGGSSKYSWAAEDGEIDAELAFKIKEFPDFVFELFLGKAPTAAGADTAGACSTAANKNGTTAISATIGCASVTVKVASKLDLKFGKYVLLVASATTVDIYFSSDADIARGTDGTMQGDTLKVTATPLTVTSAGTTDVPNFGLTITGGSGTIGMTVGDTATFEVKPPSTKSMAVRIGARSDTFPEFGAILMAQKRGNQELFEIDAFRVKASGMPLPFEANAWAEADIKGKVLYDSDQDAIMAIRHITPSGT